MRKKVSDKTVLEDGSAASTGHAPKKNKPKEIKLLVEYLQEMLKKS